MAWDSGKPTDQQKIRSLGTVIRPNWDAIEQGDIVGTSDMLRQYSLQLRNRNDAAVVVDPVTQGETFYLYSKEDGGGVAEGYFRDAAGNIVQISNDGKIGSLATSYEAENINFDGDATRVFDENSMVVAWGAVTGAGVLSYGHNMSATITKSGATYVMNLNADVMANANYVVLVTAVGNTANARIDSSFTQTATQFKVIRDSDNAGFYFACIGGQA